MSEDTQTKEREAEIQEMLRDSKVVQLPNEFNANPVIHRGDETLDAPMIVKEMSSAGHVWVWDTRTYEKIPVLYYMLPAKMRQRRPDGSYRFTTTDPKQLPWRGTLKCFLHTDDENRKHYDGLGFRVCTKSNLTNPYQRNRHMQMKHGKEWASIEAERTEKERMEDRKLQRAILEKLSPVAVSPAIVEEEVPLYVSDKDRKKR